MRASVVGIIGLATIIAGTAISVALKPREEPSPAAAAVTPELPAPAARGNEVPWPTTGMSPPRSTMPAGTEQTQPAALSPAATRTMMTPDEREERRDGSLRDARRASDGGNYAERRAQALEAARAQPEMESVEEPAAEEPPEDSLTEEPLSDQMEAEGLDEFEEPEEPAEPEPETPG